MPHPQPDQPGPTYGQPPFTDTVHLDSAPAAADGAPAPSWSAPRPDSAWSLATAQPHPGTPPLAPRSNALGLLGFGLVVVGAVVMVPSMVVLGDSLAAYVLEHGLGEANSSWDDPQVLAWANTVSGWVYAVQGACVAGLIGWIVSIVAVATRAGRGFGWAGVLLGIATPILAGLAGYLTLALALQGS